jgi:two-component system chemotaxis sensor kinase CheA
VDEALLRQILPIFLAEAREQLQEITAGVLEMERGPVLPATLDAVRRTAHSLKGSASSLSFEQIELLAHAVEDTLSVNEGAPALGAGPTDAILRTLEAIDHALDRAESGADWHIATFDELMAGLQGKSAGDDERGAPSAGAPATEQRDSAGQAAAPGPEPLAEGAPDAGMRAGLTRLEEHLRKLCSADLEDRTDVIAEAQRDAARLTDVGSPWLGELGNRIAGAFGKLTEGGTAAAKATAEIAGYLADLRMHPGPPAAPAPDLRPAPAPAPARLELRAQGPADRTIRVGASTIDAVTRHLEILALGEGRHERRARELLTQEAALKEALRLCEQTASELRLVGTSGAPAPLAEGIHRLRGLGRELSRLGREALRDSEQQRLVSATLRDDLRDIRMVPASLALEPLRRTVRDVASRQGKEVELELVGGDARLDRRVLDELKAPLVHLIRNAVDHGIELPAERRAAGKDPKGSIVVRVEPRGSRIGLVVTDDGSGLSLERVRASAVKEGVLTSEAAAAMPDAEVARLIFRPGVSTSQGVTAISGRGVGLDVVLEAVLRLQGSIEVSFVPGRETCFSIDLPLTLAATLGVLFRAGGEVGAFPAAAIERSLRLGPNDLGTVGGKATVVLGSHQIPYVLLAQVLGLPSAVSSTAKNRPAIILSMGGQRVALGVDELLGQQQLVVNTLGSRAARVGHLAGASVLDDGRVIGVLNPAEILRRARPENLDPTRAQAPARIRILVADDALTTRSAMKALLEIAGFTVLPAADGEEALALLRQTPCQLVVSDVQMPRMDGLTLARSIKSDPQLGSMPVILVTSLDSPEDRAAGLRAGADGYLVKREVERGKLLELVRQLLPAKA